MTKRTGCAPKNKKEKGLKLERRVVRALHDFRLLAIRVKEQAAIKRGHPLFKVDVMLWFMGAWQKIQCKRSGNRCSFVYSAVKEAEGLIAVIQDDGKEPIVCVPLSLWPAHLKLAERSVPSKRPPSLPEFELGSICAMTGGMAASSETGLTSAKF